MYRVGAGGAADLQEGSLLLRRLVSQGVPLSGTRRQREHFRSVDHYEVFRPDYEPYLEKLLEQKESRTHKTTYSVRRSSFLAYISLILRWSQ